MYKKDVVGNDESCKVKKTERTKEKQKEPKKYI